MSQSSVESLIRSVGARATPARVRVLSLLRLARLPLSHGDIEEALTQRAQPGMDRVTLYRVLDWLTEAGFVHRAADARGVFRFSVAEPNVEHASHVHFRCTGCGGVYCLEARFPQLPSLPEGFRLSGMQMDISGECSRCNRESA